MRSRGLYDVTFIPTQQTQYYVNVTFNECDVPGSPFKVEIQPQSAELKKMSQLTISDSADTVDRAYMQPPASLEHQSDLMHAKANNNKSPTNAFDPSQIVKGKL